jgi:magnesium transporter
MTRAVSDFTQKVRKPLDTLSSTGEPKDAKTCVTVVSYSPTTFNEVHGNSLAECLPGDQPGITWINISGLKDMNIIKQVAKRFNLHPLTVEDILNVGHYSKMEEYEHYCFISLKMLLWRPNLKDFYSEQLSIVFSEKFIITFQETETDFFDDIYHRLRDAPGKLRQQGSDYLIYRLIDSVVDQYFVALDGMSDQLENLEEMIIATPTPKHSRIIYHLKRKVLLLRKAIWPIREAINRLLHAENEFITPFTRLYFRDVYDHTIQAIDTLESFRDMLSGLLDVYLTSVSNKMNEIMKVLTIIATIFIPITFIASIYGMNFKNIPELNTRWGYPVVLCVMFLVAISMLIFFRRKKWL